MTTIRTMSLTPAIPRLDRSAVRKAHANRPLLITAALLLAVLIADAVLIAMAAPSIAEIGSLYAAVT